MDLRTAEPAPIVHIEFLELDVERKYRYPYMCKLVGWLVIMACAVSGIVFCAYYATAFGPRRIAVWITVSLVSFIFNIVIFDTVKILIVSIIRSLWLRKTIVVLRRNITYSMKFNPVKPSRKDHMLNLRKYSSLYKPPVRRKLDSRLDDVKYNLEMSNLVQDNLPFVVFMFLALAIIYGNISPLFYHSHQVIVEHFLHGNYTDSIPITEVHTQEKFILFLNETFFPALFPNISKIISSIDDLKEWSWNATVYQTRSSPDSFRKKREADDPSGSDSHTVLMDMGWTIVNELKLIGKPRFRQIRVRPDVCRSIRKLRPRSLKCAARMGFFNVETRDFSLYWKPGRDIWLSNKQAEPWRYQSALKTRTLPLVGKYGIYPAGGYVLTLAKNLKDARGALQFIEEFQWIDYRTRAVLVEFTLYCVNTNLYNVVTLIFEETGTGYYVPSYEIMTTKFDLDTWVYWVEFIFFFLLCGFIFRESIRIYRTSLKLYLLRIHAMVDLSLIILAFLGLFFYLISRLTTNVSISKLEKCTLVFVDFRCPACFYKFFIYTLGVFVGFASYKALRLLLCYVGFFEIQTALALSNPFLLEVSFRNVLLVITLAIFFYLIFGEYHEHFSTFENSFVSLMPPDIYSKLQEFFVPTILIVFAFVTCVLFIKLCTAAICLYFQKVREVPLSNRHDIFSFLRYYMTVWRQKDVLRKREGEIVHAPGDPGILRLKGGRKKSRRYRKEMRCEEQEENVGDVQKVYLKDFVTKKLYDTTRYTDLSADRELALRYYMVFLMSRNEKTRSILSELCLRLLFCSMVTEKNILQKNAPVYFTVIGKSGYRVMEKKRFSEIKKVVERFGKERGLVAFNDPNEEEICFADDKLSLLEEKLNILLDKLGVEYVSRYWMGSCVV